MLSWRATCDRFYCGGKSVQSLCSTHMLLVLLSATYVGNDIVRLPRIHVSHFNNQFIHCVCQSISHVCDDSFQFQILWIRQRWIKLYRYMNWRFRTLPDWIVWQEQWPSIKKVATSRILIDQFHLSCHDLPFPLRAVWRRLNDSLTSLAKPRLLDAINLCQNKKRKISRIINMCCTSQ